MAIPTVCECKCVDHSEEISELKKAAESKATVEITPTICGCKCVDYSKEIDELKNTAETCCREVQNFSVQLANHDSALLETSNKLREDVLLSRETFVKFSQSTMEFMNTHVSGLNSRINQTEAILKNHFDNISSLKAMYSELQDMVAPPNNVSTYSPASPPPSSGDDPPAQPAQAEQCDDATTHEPCPTQSPQNHQDMHGDHKKPKVHVFGDSILLQAKEYLEFLSDDIIVHAVSGANFASTAKLISSKQREIDEEDSVIVMAGTNDAKDKQLSREKCSYDMDYCLDEAHRSTQNVLMIAPPPTTRSPELIKSLIDVQRLLKSKCDSYEVSNMNITNFFMDSNGHVKPRHFKDGLHLTDSGIQRLLLGILKGVRHISPECLPEGPICLTCGHSGHTSPSCDQNYW